MKPEEMKAAAQKEANKHRFEHIRKTVTNDKGKEETTGENRPVKIVWVCMPKQQAFLDPSDEQKDSIREHAANTNQTIYEFEHKHGGSEENKIKRGRNKKETAE